MRIDFNFTPVNWSFSDQYLIISGVETISSLGFSWENKLIAALSSVAIAQSLEIAIA
ncbi:MAG: hypothetical protein AB4041_04985 [Microcystaceae cyanobacterium]